MRRSLGGAGVGFVVDAGKTGGAFWSGTPYFCLKWLSELTSSVRHIINSHCSVSSVVSEGGRDWLDLIGTPDDFSQKDLEHIEETVQTYFEFPDVTENDVDNYEYQSAASVSDSDRDSTTDLSPSSSARAGASAGDYNWPPHQDEFLDMPWEDVRETVIRTSSNIATMLPIYCNGLSKYGRYSLEIILNACTSKVPIEAIDSHQLYQCNESINYRV